MKPTTGLAAVEATMDSGRVVYEVGRSLTYIRSDMHHGCPIDGRELKSWREIPITDLHNLFPKEKLKRAIDCVVDPRNQPIYFMGAAKQTN